MAIPMSYEKDRDTAAVYLFTGNTGPQARAFCNGADWAENRRNKMEKNNLLVVDKDLIIKCLEEKIERLTLEIETYFNRN